MGNHNKIYLNFISFNFDRIKLQITSPNKTRGSVIALIIFTACPLIKVIDFKCIQYTASQSETLQVFVVYNFQGPRNYKFKP